MGPTRLRRLDRRQRLCVHLKGSQKLCLLVYIDDLLSPLALQLGYPENPLGVPLQWGSRTVLTTTITKTLLRRRSHREASLGFLISTKSGPLPRHQWRAPKRLQTWTTLTWVGSD